MAKILVQYFSTRVTDLRVGDVIEDQGRVKIVSGVDKMPLNIAVSFRERGSVILHPDTIVKRLA